MLNLKPVLEAIEGLIRHTESEIKRLQEELERLRKDRATILDYMETMQAAHEVAQRYGDILPEEPVPEAVQRFAKGIVPAFTRFLVQAWQDGRTFSSRVALAKAAVADPEIGQRYSTWRSLAKPEVLKKLLEEVKVYVPYLFGQDEENSRNFLRYLEDLCTGFPPLKKERKPKEKVKERVTRPYWYGGRGDPLHRVKGGGRVAALAFEAILPVKNGRCDYEQVPCTQEELVKGMWRINESTGKLVRRIDLVKYGFRPLDRAVQAALEGDFSLLGEERVKRILQIYKFASVTAFYEGHFLPLMEGKEVPKHQPGTVEIDTERHLAVAGRD